MSRNTLNVIALLGGVAGSAVPSANNLMTGLNMYPSAGPYAFSSATANYPQSNTTVTDAKIYKVAYPYVKYQDAAKNDYFAAADGMLYDTDAMRARFDTMKDNTAEPTAEKIDVAFGMAMNLHSYMSAQAFEKMMRKKTSVSYVLQKAAGMVTFIDANKALKASRMTDAISYKNYLDVFYSEKKFIEGYKFADPMWTEANVDATVWGKVLKPAFPADEGAFDDFAGVFRPFIMCVNLTHPSGALMSGPEGLAVLSKQKSTTLSGTPNVYKTNAKMTVTSVLSKNSAIASGQDYLHKTKLQYPTDLKSMMNHGETQPIIVYMEHSHRQDVFQNWMGQVIKTSMDESHMAKLNRYITSGKIAYWSPDGNDVDKLTQFKRYMQMYKIFTYVAVDTDPKNAKGNGSILDKTVGIRAYLHFLDGDLVFLTDEAVEKLSPKEGTHFQIYSGYQHTENMDFAINGTSWSDVGLKAVRDANVESTLTVKKPSNEEDKQKTKGDFKDDEDNYVFSDEDMMRIAMKDTRVMETVEDVTNSPMSPPNIQMTPGEKHKYMALRNAARSCNTQYVRDIYEMFSMKLQPTRNLPTSNPSVSLTQENLYSMASTVCADIGCGTRKVLFMCTYPGFLKFYEWMLPGATSGESHEMTQEDYNNLFGYVVGVSEEDKDYPRMVSSVRESLLNCNVFTPQGEAGTCFALQRCNGGCAMMRLDNFASSGVNQCSTGITRVGPQTNNDSSYTLMDQDTVSEDGQKNNYELKSRVMGVCPVAVFNECEDANSGFKLMQSNLTAYSARESGGNDDFFGVDDDEDSEDPKVLRSPCENGNATIEWNPSNGQLLFQEDHCGQCCTPCASTTIYLAGYNETTSNNSCTVCCNTTVSKKEDIEEVKSNAKVIDLIKARSEGANTLTANASSAQMFGKSMNKLQTASKALVKALPAGATQAAFGQSTSKQPGFQKTKSFLSVKSNTTN